MQHQQQGILDWTKEGRVLTVEQKQFYRDNGYLVVRNCIPQHELERYTNRFQELCEGRNVPTTMSIMRDMTLKGQKLEEKTVNKVQDFGDDPVLFDYCKYLTVLDVVRDLIGDESSSIVAMHTMLINKPPDNGKLTSRHPMHQDMEYFCFPPEDHIVCAWTAMERVNRANGCLVVVPGSHKGKLLPHTYPDWEGGVNKAYHGIQNYDPSMPRLHVEMEAGDTVFFHPILIHGSGANKTAGFRKAISCHYANDDVCRYKAFENQNQIVCHFHLNFSNSVILEGNIERRPRYGKDRFE
ncbi:hypothetical protein WR25_03365 isoform A [Diploscapter pachys]|uniref:phytanoyl-CoA dioxygenase n=1 Tax=Diploscapter pachys TaxID=2018661 RepID=A0A2A2LLD6_9BILA|nr:hypothetical protein WR25_03365 isoform A [Diploscapter pachys]